MARYRTGMPATLARSSCCRPGAPTRRPQSPSMISLDSSLTMPDITFSKTEPASGGYFLLREELDSFFALHMKVSEKGLIPAIEWKPSHGRGHTNIYTHHARLNPVLELTSSLA